MREQAHGDVALALRASRAFRGALASIALLIALPAAATDLGFEPRIVNGLASSGFPTTGLLLRGANPESAGSWCSGTMIGCQTFLTAAHCVCDGTGSNCQSGGGPLVPDPADYHVFLQHGGVHAVSNITVHPGYAFPVADLAVIELASPVDGISPSPLNTLQRLAFGSSGTIVGFGRSGGGNNDYGLKRFGDVATAPCPAGVSDASFVCWNFTAPVGPPGTDSNTCNADSGGPLFADVGSTSVLAGVTSGGVGLDCLAPDQSYDTDVLVYAPFILAAGGADLGAATCGALPQVGQAGADVKGFAGSLTGGTIEARHSFDVAAGTAVLRVALNAIDDGPSDFDLFVEHGAPPSRSHFDCARDGSGQFAACEFPAPQAGTWHVLVDRAAGGGAYQVTATAFAGPAPGLSVTLDIPVISVPAGEPVPFTMRITNTRSATASFALSLVLGLPGGSTLPLLPGIPLALPGGADVSLDLALPLPASAPLGTYTLGAGLFQPGSGIVSQDIATVDLE